MAEAPLLEARALARSFGGGRRWYGALRPPHWAVREVSFTLARGRTLGIVGESGSGKSTLARLVTGLLAPTRGEILLDGKAAARRGRRIQLVFQDPAGSLNPRKRVRRILEGPLEVLTERDRVERRARIDELLELVRLRPDSLDRFPHEFSGGQAQRIAIARALAAEPEILVLDEAVSALDVSIQAQILRLLRELQDRLGLAYLFISHDLAVVETLAEEVLVMKDGVVVEAGAVRDVFRAPRAAYTAELLAAVPSLPDHALGSEP